MTSLTQLPAVLTATRQQDNADAEWALKANAVWCVVRDITEMLPAGVCVSHVQCAYLPHSHPPGRVTPRRNSRHPGKARSAV